MTLGRLISFEIYDPKTKKTKVKRFRQKWLATSPNGRTLSICTVSKRAPTANPSKAVKKLHKQFHRSDPKGMWEGHTPEPAGKLKQIGWLKALTYSVPRSKIKSPEKNPHFWHHSFGDTGHRGGDYHPKYFPAVMQDERGNLFVRRRPGNIFKTSDWVRG